MARDYRKNKQQEDQGEQLAGSSTAIYLRVSTNRQVDGYSIDAQRTQLLAYCVGQGWDVSEEHIYVDAGVSGKTDERPRFQAMIADAKQRQFYRIVALKIDRVARNLINLLDLIDTLAKAGVALVCVKESFDTGTANGRFMLQVLGAVSELERSMIADRMDSGRSEKARQGGYNGSRCPLGYTYKDSKFEISERAETVRDLFTWFNDGMSLNAIMRKLSDENVPTATGKGAWSIKGIKHILANGAYAGIAQWNGVEAPGSYPPIVNSATYDAAQERLRSMSRGKRVDLISEV